MFWSQKHEFLALPTKSDSSTHLGHCAWLLLFLTNIGAVNFQIPCQHRGLNCPCIAASSPYVLFIWGLFNMFISKYKINFCCKSLDLGFLSSSRTKTVFKTTHLFTITTWTSGRPMYTIIHTKILSYHTPMITFAWPGWKFLSSVTRALTNFTCRIEHNLDIKSIQVFNEYLPPCITALLLLPVTLTGLKLKTHIMKR